MDLTCDQLLSIIATITCVLLKVQAVSWIYQTPGDPVDENDRCGKENGRLWFCKKVADCPAAKAILQHGGQLKTCSWKDAHTHIICCPDSISDKYVDKPPSISAVKCEQYERLLCRRGAFNGLGGFRRSIKSDCNYQPKLINASIPKVTAISGGYLVKPLEHPHMAAIGYDVQGAISWECGGSLISPIFVLSAAHCAHTPYGPARWVRLGDLDLSTDQDKARPQTLRIVERVVHKDYSPPTFYNDIALFRLERSAVFDEYVGLACLHPSLDELQGVGIATGWGKNESNGPRSPALIQVDLKFIPTETCKKDMDDIKTYLPQGFDVETMLCAGEPGKDTCQGDSGGPLVIKNKDGRCLHRQVGVTSFGPKNCGSEEVSGTYVRVANFLPWIESVVWPEEAEKICPSVVWTQETEAQSTNNGDKFNSF